MKGAGKRLGDILIQEDVLTTEQLDQALAEQAKSGGFIGAALVRLGFIDEEELTTFLVKQCRIPYLKLSGFTVDQKIASLVPPAVCHQHQILPVDKLGNLLTVAMVNPLDIEALEAVKASVPFRIKPIICSWYDFDRLFEQLFGHLTAEERAMTTPAAAPAPAAPTSAAGQSAPASAEAPPPPDAQAVARAAEATQATPAAMVPPADPGLLDGLTFDTFVVAEANTFTVAVAHSIADAPGQEHNPFFLYGAPGLGKTHLVNAIGHAVHQRGGGPVSYLPAGRFSDAMIEAVRYNQLEQFRARYQQLAVLILDDVQFFAGRERVQEEFFHLFNLLHQRRRQIIVVSDVPPKQLANLEGRLVSRFEGGMVVTVEPPDFDTRMAILRQELDAVGGDVPPAVLEMLAREIASNVRELQGALKKLLAYAALVGHEITDELAHEILKHLFAQMAQ